MHEVLVELVVVMAGSVLAALVLRQLRLPPVVGFILVGILVGPGGLRLITNRHTIEVVAEVGVMLLLFTVGLKLKLSDLWRMRGTVFGSGSLQVVATGAAAAGAALALGRPTVEAVVWGMVAALSSTALVMFLLEGSGQTSSPLGRGQIGILLLQDLAVVPIMLALPLLAGREDDTAAVIFFLLRAVGIIVLTILGARLIFPALAARVVDAGSRELFTLTTVLVAVGTALVFGKFGLSMALGAFLAGMVVSESEFVSRMVDDVTPLRDVFNSVFFVSLGMLVEPAVWFSRPLVILGLVLAVVVGKALLAGLAVWPAVRDVRLAGAVGLGLSQIGEFSVVVGAEAVNLGAFSGENHRLFLAVAVPTMILAPGLNAIARRLADRCRAGCADLDLDGHQVIVGYGVNGRNVHRALRLLEVPHAVVDLNPHTIRELEEEGEPAVYGDAGQEAVLRAAGVHRARGVIVSIPDASATREVVKAVRAIDPEVTIIARTRYVREVRPLEELGANQVIPEEFETSLELVGRVLDIYGATPAVILKEKMKLRRQHYGVLRAGDLPAGSGDPLPFGERLRLVEVEVTAGSAAAGRSLRDLDLRRITGATVLAVHRNGETSTNPSPDTVLQAGHRLAVLADGACEAKVREMVGASEPPPG